MKVVNIFFALVIFIAYGCEKEIAYDGDKLTNFMVTNALLEKDSLIKCRVTRSNSVQDKGLIPLISDATVELYQNSHLIENLEYTENGYYQSKSRKALAGQNYSLKITQKQYSTIKGNCSIPQAIHSNLNSVVYNSFENRYYFNLNIEDKPGKNHYRLLVFFLEYGSSSSEGNPSLSQTLIYSSDPVLNYNLVTTDENEISDYPDNIYKIFNDQLFDNENYQLKFSIYGLEGNKIKIVLQHINNELYEYYNSVQTNIYYKDNPLSEPVRVQSNIKNGSGIIGGINSTAFFVTLPKEN